MSEMATANAQRLERRLQEIGPNESQAAMFSMRGVMALNQNDWQTARQDFLYAYRLDPSNAFSLNNRGYVAELDGDLESAQFFYEKAQKAGTSEATVGLATQPSAQGKSLLTVAADSSQKVDSALDRYGKERRRENGPIELTPRGNTGRKHYSNTATIFVSRVTDRGAPILCAAVSSMMDRDKDLPT